jgi:Zn-dependent protease/CBS domain-containing protein
VGRRAPPHPHRRFERYRQVVGDTFVLGRVYGIRIAINWSWLLVAVLITWTLAAGVFPSQNPGLSDTAYVLMGVVASLLFFASILLHELGHAIQARREGVPIEGITLWALGGVAKIAGRFPSAGAELRIAVAGPLVSLALGLLFTGLAVAVSSPEEVDAVAAWLGYINLALLVFNLIPAFPLDGGRILRSALWAYRGDLARATREAAGVGKAFAFLLIAAAVLLFVVGSVFSGVWLAFIGWFLIQAAQAESQQVTIEETLGGLTVRDLMSPRPVAVPRDLPLGRLVDEVVWAERYTTYPVVDDRGAAVGLLPFRAVAEAPRAEWDGTTVGERMLPLERVPVLSPDEPAADALRKVAGSEAGRALVVEDGRLVGLLSISDLLRALELGGPPPRSRDAA